MHLESLLSRLLLPKPSGVFFPGFIDYQWTPDSSQADLIQNHGQVLLPTHPILARIWYPSSLTESQGERHLSYWIPSDEYHLDTNSSIFTGRKTSQCLLGNQLIYGVEGADVNSRIHGETAPLIVFSHGLLGFRNSHTALFSQLASHGYIVAAIEHRDGTAAVTAIQEPDSIKVKLFEGRVQGNDLESLRSSQLGYRHREVSSLLDLLLANGPVPINTWKIRSHKKSPSRTSHISNPAHILGHLKSLIDPNRVVLGGHCLGGSAALTLSQVDTRINAVFALHPLMLSIPADFSTTRNLPTFFFIMEKNANDIKKLHAPEEEGVKTFPVMTQSAGNPFDITDTCVMYSHRLPSSRLRPIPGMQPFDGGPESPQMTLTGFNTVLFSFLKQILCAIGPEVESPPSESAVLTESA